MRARRGDPEPYRRSDGRWCVNLELGHHQDVRRHLEQTALTASRTAHWVDYGLLFPGDRGQALRGSTVYRRLRRLLAKHGLPVMRWHDLRHSATSILLALGVPAIVVQRVLGHASLQMIGTRYGHVIPEVAAADLARAESVLFGGAAETG